MFTKKEVGMLDSYNVNCARRLEVKGFTIFLFARFFVPYFYYFYVMFTSNDLFVTIIIS